MTRVAVLASHEGTTLQAVLDACDQHLEACVVLVISNNSSSGALRRARTAGVPALHISTKTHPDTDAAMLDALDSARADLILLLGYMKKLGPGVLRAYAGRVLNTHPALLPKFGGKGYFGRAVHEAVLAAGETETGATVHLVDAEYDSGNILAQACVPITPGCSADELEAEVKRAERALLIDTLRRYIATTSLPRVESQ